MCSTSRASHATAGGPEPERCDPDRPTTRSTLPTNQAKRAEHFQDREQTSQRSATRDRAAAPAVRLDPTVIEELVDRLSEVVVECVLDAIRAAGIIPHTATTAEWLDAKEVAQRLGFDRDWVYEHAEELGATRHGTGPRPRLRFPAGVVDSRRGKQTSSEAGSGPTKPRAKPNGLIPIRAS